MHEIGLENARALLVPNDREKPGAEPAGGDRAVGIHHDQRDLMMRTQITDRFDPPHHLGDRVERRSAATQRLDRDHARADARDEFAGAGRGRGADAGFDEQSMPGDRRVTHATRHLERKPARRAGRTEQAVPVAGEDADRVVSKGCGAFHGIATGSEEPAPGR